MLVVLSIILNNEDQDNNSKKFVDSHQRIRLRRICVGSVGMRTGQLTVNHYPY